MLATCLLPISRRRHQFVMEGRLCTVLHQAERSARLPAAGYMRKDHRGRVERW
jgi:hypothetical protein